MKNASQHSRKGEAFGNPIHSFCFDDNNNSHRVLGDLNLKSLNERHLQILLLSLPVHSFYIR